MRTAHALCALGLSALIVATAGAQWAGLTEISITGNVDGQAKAGVYVWQFDGGGGGVFERIWGDWPCQWVGINSEGGTSVTLYFGIPVPSGTLLPRGCPARNLSGVVDGYTFTAVEVQGLEGYTCAPEVPDQGPDFDDDGDGYTENDGDCVDSNPDINPGAADTPGDGIDSDCDGDDDATPNGPTPDDPPSPGGDGPTSWLPEGRYVWVMNPSLSVADAGTHSRLDTLKDALTVSDSGSLPQFAELEQYTQTAQWSEALQPVTVPDLPGRLTLLPDVTTSLPLSFELPFIDGTSTTVLVPASIQAAAASYRGWLVAAVHLAAVFACWRVLLWSAE